MFHSARINKIFSLVCCIHPVNWTVFANARIKLTVWYLLIIMLISISFSAAMYRTLTSELDRVERIQRVRMEDRFPELPRLPISSELRNELAHPFMLDLALVEETKNRLKIFLATINLIILGASAGAGYFLAGRTLKPIKEMVDEQSRFITDASHELRTPLTSLKTEVEVNLRNKNLTLSEAKKLLISNLEEVNKLQVLSDGLIKLTQYQKGNNGLSVVNLSLASIIDEATKKVINLAKNRDITIVNKIIDARFEGDRQALVELFVIFLDNAIKYSSAKTKISLTSEKTDSYVSVHIADQGVGINQKDIPHLFDRFYRADKSRTKSDVAGYGLGLSIAKQIIDKHHGVIRIQSTIDKHSFSTNKGTTFTAQIPFKHSPRLI